MCLVRKFTGETKMNFYEKLEELLASGKMATFVVGATKSAVGTNKSALHQVAGAVQSVDLGLGACIFAVKDADGKKHTMSTEHLLDVIEDI